MYHVFYFIFCVCVLLSGGTTESFLFYHNVIKEVPYGGRSVGKEEVQHKGNQGSIPRGAVSFIQ